MTNKNEYSDPLQQYFYVNSENKLKIKDEYWKNPLISPILVDQEINELSEHFNDKIMQHFSEFSFKIKRGGTRTYTVKEFFQDPDLFEVFSQIRLFCEREFDVLGTKESDYKTIALFLCKTTNWSHHNEKKTKHQRQLKKDDLYFIINLFKYLITYKFFEKPELLSLEYQGIQLFENENQCEEEIETEFNNNQTGYRSGNRVEQKTNKILREKSWNQN
ncbi:hypothetical protein M0812_11279 [Anaeramoeba flamelloides]|uniref:Uncharacterized protein n=1 Tax=Anaeramoeba flamelloides TaxID=1746091 RepID=A0AAV7ZX77_9EUKA|nr:hypothetical protein M0812_11279 [Anaeramoeba flamelloides]